MDRPTFNSTAELRQYLYDHDVLPLRVEEIKIDPNTDPEVLANSPKRNLKWMIYLRHHKQIKAAMQVLPGDEYYFMALK